MIWRLGLLSVGENELDLTLPDEDIPLPQLGLLKAMDMRYAITGVAVEQHIMSRYRPAPEKRGILSSRDLERITPNRAVTVAGLNMVHQSPPTAKGHHFITLEDEYGFINVIIRPKVYAHCRKIIRGSSLLLVVGTAQRKGVVVNLIAAHFTTLHGLE